MALLKHNTVRQEEKGMQDLAFVYGSGPFQRMTLLCGQLAGFVFVCHHMAFALLAPSVDHWCSPPAEYANFTSAQWKNVGIPLEENGRYSQCSWYNPPLDVSSSNHSEERCENWEYDTETYGDTVVSQWNLVCERKWILMLQSTIFMAGAMVAAPILGQFADLVGRKPVIRCSVVVILAAAFGTWFSQILTSFTVLRFLVGGAASGVRLLTFVLLFELVLPEDRSYYCTVVHVGTVLARMFINSLRMARLSRETVFAVLMVPTILLVSAFYMVDESPRWLLATCGLKNTERQVLRVATRNGLPSSVAKQRWAGLRPSHAKHSAKASVVHLLRSRLLRQRSLVISCCWLSYVLGYYNLLVNQTHRVSEWAQLLAGVLQAPAFVGTYALMQRSGRRIIFYRALLAQGFITLAAAVSELYGLSSLRLLEDVLFVAAYCLSNLTMIISYVYSVELFPTVVRGVAISGAYMCGRLGGLATPFLNDLCVTVHGSMSNVVAGGLCLLSGLLAWRLPETKVLDLPDTIQQEEHRFQKLNPVGGEVPARVTTPSENKQKS